MSSPRTRPSRRPIALAVLVSSLTVAGTVGCAATAAPEGPVLTEDVARATPAPTVTSAAEGSEAETCTAFGDVLTIVHNADAGFVDGRMEEQEQLGWYRLATRVLARIPSPDEGAVAEALAAVSDAAPAVTQGAAGAPGIGSEEWNLAVNDLATACAAAGYDLAAEGFTGG
ncbi:hypothetical protein [Microbacterium sp. 179-I 3D3 NHS]|uniref:hypothetical protein n=1 Tax=Microbacterium sp. 179-I 3D3 NHS TaxID=3142382 RepID=UPI0039A16566